MPEEVQPRDLDVSLQPFNIRVAHKHTKEVCTPPDLAGQAFLYMLTHASKSWRLCNVSKRAPFIQPPRIECLGFNCSERLQL